MRIAVIIALACCACVPAQALETDVRVKWFGTVSALPDHDVARTLASTPQLDQNTDLRLMASHRSGALEFVAHHATTLISGDAFELNRSLAASSSILDQTPLGDERRVADLTWRIGEGSRHELIHRFDRLAVKYRKGLWAVTVGREAVSWGSGIVFQPMDLFNPFSPTVVDRDYKAGDDLVHVQKLFNNGSDLELLVVGRRNVEEEITGNAASVGAKWHGFVGASELELMAAKHYDDRVAGLSWRIPLGGALLRSDIVATKVDRDDRWRVSGLVNLDYSLEWAGKNLYLFGEFYHNGFGLSRIDPVPQPTPELLDRLSRGEVFNVLRNYVAVGGNVQWHPLWTQTLTVITSLDDRSSLLQTSFSFDPGDHARMEVGFITTFGRPGDEYGGIGAGVTPQGQLLTSGGGTRAFVRWVYFL